MVAPERAELSLPLYIGRECLNAMVEVVLHSSTTYARFPSVTDDLQLFDFTRLCHRLSCYPGVSRVFWRPVAPY